MGDVYCSPKFKCGEDLDKALIAALSAEDNAERAEAARVAAERGVASKPNLLDNWYFVDPVNQRGQTEYTAKGYTIDRWRALNDMSVSLGKQGLTLEMAFGQQFTQFLEDYSAFDGKSLTASVLFADNTLASGTIVYDDSATDWIPGTRVFFSAKNIQFIFTHDHGFLLFSAGEVTATIKAIKLELGSVQTLAYQDENGNWVLNELPNKQQELAKCRRYFRAIDGTAYLTGMLSYASANFVIVPIDGEPMRIVPVPTMLGSSNVAVFDHTGNGLVAVSASALSKQAFGLTLADSFAQPRVPVSIICNDTIWLSADL